jgi:hypothetical protein
MQKGISKCSLTKKPSLGPIAISIITPTPLFRVPLGKELQGVVVEIVQCEVGKPFMALLRQQSSSMGVDVETR